LRSTRAASAPLALSTTSSEDLPFISSLTGVPLAVVNVPWTLSLNPGDRCGQLG
jgi:hypothetical protein